MRAIGVWSVALAVSASDAAEGAFIRGTPAIEKGVLPGPNVCALDAARSGPRRIDVIGAAEFAMQGDLTPGGATLMALAAEGRALYFAECIVKRMACGPPGASRPTGSGTRVMSAPVARRPRPRRPSRRPRSRRSGSPRRWRAHVLCAALRADRRGRAPPEAEA